MSYAAKSFGKREPRRYYGRIRKNARRRSHCARSMKRRGRIVYIELLEAIHLPFRFRIEFEYDEYGSIASLRRNTGPCWLRR